RPSMNDVGCAKHAKLHSVHDLEGHIPRAYAPNVECKSARIDRPAHEWPARFERTYSTCPPFRLRDGHLRWQRSALERPKHAVVKRERHQVKDHEESRQDERKEPSEVGSRLAVVAPCPEAQRVPANQDGNCVQAQPDEDLGRLAPAHHLAALLW